MSGNTEEDSRAAATRPTAAPNDVLTLRLGAEEHGIDILCVQEIRLFEMLSRIAGAPMQVLGVTSLRGVTVPIIDLGSGLALDTQSDSGTVDLALNLGGRTAGAVVDAVRDVAQLGAGDVAPDSEFNSALAANHLLGIATLNHAGCQRMLRMVDVERLMASHEKWLVGEPLH